MGRPKKTVEPTLDEIVEHVSNAKNEPVSDERSLEVFSSVSTHELAPSALKEVMVQEAERRALITQYILHHMKSGVDFGTIKFGNKESKPSLFKPGSEKFLSLFKLTARFEKDGDTWEMAGSESGVFAYICLLYASNGTVVGEGRGVSKLTEKQGWTVNNAVKIAEKRAQIDAVLRSGALSDFFTQDLEDMVQEPEKMAPYEVRKVEYPPMSSKNDMHGLTGNSKNTIKELLKKLGKEPETQQAARFDIKSLTSLFWTPDSNDEEVIRRLQARLDNSDVLEEFDKVIDG